jgi:hypothetical protein
MSDLYYRESWFDRHFDKIFGVTIVTLFVIGALMIYGLATNDKRLFQQCLDDGKKEYECHALIHVGGRR